jgi:hypothetical protein
MKNLLLILFGSLAIGAYNQDEISLKDFDMMLGSDWVGDLVYLDYSSNKEVKIPVDIAIEKTKKGRYSFQFNYPKEPKANSKSKISIDLDSRTISNDPIKIIEREDGQLSVVTSSKGKDNGKPASFIKTYVIGKQALTIRKEVTYDDSDEIFMRNEYRMTR